MNAVKKANYLDGAVAALEQAGLQVAPFRAPTGIPDGFADAWLRIGRGRNGVRYLVEVKCAVTASTVGGLVAQLRDRAAKAGLSTLLVTPYLTPPVAEALRAQGQQFADAAGNAFLTGPAHYVYIAGQRPKERGLPAHGGGALTANGLKILFALLCNPALALAPQRTLAAAAHVALGAVPAVLKALQGEGHVVIIQGNRRFRGTKRLLDEWAQGYARRLRPKTLHATYVAERFDTWRDWPLDPNETRWGGEPAAALLTDHLRPGVLTLYADRLPPRLLVEQRLKREEHVDAQRYVEVRRPFWGTLQVEQPRADVVPMVLVYADLLATGDGRCLETAQLLYEAHLARLLPAA
ncbi:MAG: hypothetical protein IT178_17360 [Acidobacteria bacterium]|nr:hypothetical protein [Acidobacteriota bacterium]